jgi:hypothetical protein
MNCKHEGGHYFKVKFNWFNHATVTEDKKEFDSLEIDTGFLKDWTLIQIEGEEPVPEVQEE